MSMLDKIFLFNKWSKYFRSSRPDEENKDNQEVENSVGVSQEQIDLYNYINYDYLLSPNSAITYVGVAFEQYFANKHGRIQKYKEMSLYPEISDGIDNVCDDAIVESTTSDVVDLDIIEEMPSHIEEEIRKIWNYLVTDIFAFNERAWDLFRKFLIESELYIELILNEEGNNIIGIKVLPAHTMLPVYEENKVRGYMQTKVGNPQAQDVRMQQQGNIMFDKDQIAYVNYGLYGANMLDIRGYLETAIRTYNQLKNLEDSLVVYRLCLDGESRVRTDNGYKYIKDIKIGDIVYSYTKQGKLEKTKVTNFWNQGLKKTVKIRSNHNELICTPDHPILVRNNKTGKVDYVDAGNLKVKLHQLINTNQKSLNEKKEIKIIIGEEWARLKDNSYILNLKNDNKTEVIRKVAEEVNQPENRIKQFLYVKRQAKNLPKDIAIKICKILGIDKNELFFSSKGQIYPERINLPKYVDEDFARLFGFMLGDGSINQHSLVFAEGEYQEVNEKYKNLLIKYFGKCERYGVSYRKYGNYKTCSRTGVKIFEDLGYIHGTKNKRIPSWVFNCSKEIRLAFIEGLSDADGCERYTDVGTWFSSIELANKKLVEDIKELWGSIGLCSGKITYRNPREHYSNFLKRIIHSTGSWTITLTKLELKKYENVISVENFEDREVIDIEVENKGHNFIANGCPVSNCRAPERRLWNIAIGRMPKGKAEEYLKGLIQRYRKKIIYNADTGEIDSTANIQSLTEDFWFTRNENGEGTTVETIGGGMQLGELNDINYFLQKLYKTLKLPKSRWEDSASSMYSSGKSGEILREEIKFSRFVERIRNRFKYILINPFITLLRLKGIDEKYINEDYFNVKFTTANLFKEYKESELIESRMAILGQITQFIYDKNTNPQGLFAKEFAMRKFFRMTDEDWNENEDLKKKEELQAKPPTGNETGGMGAGGFGGAPMGGTPGGGEFGATPTPELGAPPEAPPAPEVGGAVAPPPAEIAPPAESIGVKLKPDQDNDLFSQYQIADKNIQNRYNGNEKSR